MFSGIVGELGACGEHLVPGQCLDFARSDLSGSTHHLVAPHPVDLNGVTVGDVLVETGEQLDRELGALLEPHHGAGAVRFRRDRTIPGRAQRGPGLPLPRLRLWPRGLRRFVESDPIDQPDEFWLEQAKSLTWFKEPTKTLEIRTSPHILSGYSVDSIMFNVVLALLPACAYAVYLFGLASLLVLVTATS